MMVSINHSGAAAPDSYRLALQLGPRLRSGTPDSRYSIVTRLYNNREEKTRVWFYLRSGGGGEESSSEGGIEWGEPIGMGWDFTLSQLKLITTPLPEILYPPGPPRWFFLFIYRQAEFYGGDLGCLACRAAGAARVG